MKAIRTRYHGATNTRGSRITADDGDGNQVSISYPYELNHDDAHKAACDALLAKMGWTGAMVSGGYKNDMYWVFVP